MRYDYMCEQCNKDYNIEQGIDDEHTYVCPHCSIKCRRLYTTNFKIMGWSVKNEINDEAYEKKMWDALTDESEITHTMLETAKEQLTKRADRRGEDTDQAISEVFGDTPRKQKTKDELAILAKTQREMIDRRETI